MTEYHIKLTIKTLKKYLMRLVRTSKEKVWEDLINGTKYGHYILINGIEIELLNMEDFEGESNG